MLYIVLEVHRHNYSECCFVVPVCKHGKSAILAYEGAKHADLLRSEKLQGQRLTWDQYEGNVGKNWQILHAVLIVQGTAVKLLHV